MTVRRRRYRLAMAAVAALLLLAPAARADASECWLFRPPCANGAITSSSVEPTLVGGDIIVRLGGWSAMCPAPVTPPPSGAKYEFGLIIYGTGGSWLARLTEYGSTQGLHPFTYRVNYTAERPLGPMVAACLAYDYHERMSCVAVDFNQNPIVTPISVHDPRVAFERVTRPCGHCVEDPGIQ
jgi:hypothetical protein